MDASSPSHLLPDRIDAVRERLERAAQRGGREDAVTLIAVTKTYPIETIRAAVEAGLRDFGENRVQELAEKAGQLPGAHAGGDVRWHLIGSLQSNKSADTVELADAFHALDRAKLVRTLGAAAADAGRELAAFVQVNVSGEASKHGVAPGAAHALIDTAAEAPGLRVVGLMGMAAPARSEADRERSVRPAFARLREIRDTYVGPGRGELVGLSMGMSGDYEIAVEEGATHVRVGSALFGGRSPRHAQPVLRRCPRSRPGDSP